jgi:hypothetical protein
VDVDQFSIAKLDLGPRDVLVVRAKHPIPADVVERLRALMRTAVGDRPVLVLDSELDLAVLKRHDMEAMG